MSCSGVLRAVLVALDAFTAVTAIGRGIALTSGLEADQFPIDLLRATPLRSCRLPGVFLGGVVGGSAAVAAASGLRRLRLVRSTSALAGTVLILGAREAPSRVETGYFALGLLMATFGVVMLVVDHRQPRAVRMPADLPN